ncbi:putative metal-binding motif-containing protein [Myxococcota bacterium]|nr:putative metal-binding motif-containing protein [Myxococcota bacterium]
MRLLLPTLWLACGDKSGDDPGGTGGVDCPTPSSWYVDADGDGFGAGESTGASCERPDGHVANAQDCDDGDATAHPGADEVCDGVDNDCDGSVDPETSLDIRTCWQDADGDGFGDPLVRVLACDCTGGLVDDDTDCDDADPDVWPGASEVLYDGVDQDCMGLVGEYDSDGDGYDWEGGAGVEGEDCDDTDPEIHPMAYELCGDDIDQDCDGRLDACGLDEVTDPGDAWLTVYRDNEDTADSAFFGNNLAWAGDGDGDGRPEVLAEVVGIVGEDDYSRYHLLELPSETAGGQVLLEDLITATWDVPRDGSGGATHMTNALSMADVDLDGDGYLDYILTAGIYPVASDGARLYLTLGPVAGDVDLDALMSLRANDTLSFPGPPRLLVPPSDGDWTVAVYVWPTEDHMESQLHQAVMLVGPEHFSGAEDWMDAPAIWTANGWELRDSSFTVEDLDGDGVRDIVSGTFNYKGPDPIGRVLVFQGPISPDISFDDADQRFETGLPVDRLSLTLAAVGDGDGDGHTTVMVGDQAQLEGQVDTLWLIEPTTWGAGAVVDSAAAYARIEATEDSGFSWYKPALLGDVDGDGVDEVGIPAAVEGDSTLHRVRIYELPEAGVMTMDEVEREIVTDEDIDGYAGFGSSIIPGHDMDGDGLADLLVGEFYWDADPTQDYLPFGRFLIFRGDGGG